MNENLSSMQEDITIIKSILAQTMTGLKSVSSFFTTYGIILLCYAVVQGGLYLWLQLGVVTGGYSEAYYSRVSSAYSWIMFAVNIGMYGVLALLFFFRRKREKAHGLHTLSLKLLDIWGVCLAAFLFLSLMISFILPVYWGHVARDMETQRMLGYGSVYLKQVLYFVFPVLPVLITAVFSGDKRALGLGFGAFAAAMVWLMMTQVRNAETITAGLAVWLGTVNFLIRATPAVVLLLFGRLLKKDKTYGTA